MQSGNERHSITVDCALKSALGFVLQLEHSSQLLTRFYVPAYSSV
jgi:hypothetical protein